MIPVAANGYQHLTRIRRTGEDSFEEEDLGAVRFVPLIGEEGWTDERADRAQAPSGNRAEPNARSRPSPGKNLSNGELAEAIREAAESDTSGNASRREPWRRNA